MQYFHRKVPVSQRIAILQGPAHSQRRHLPSPDVQLVGRYHGRAAERAAAWKPYPTAPQARRGQRVSCQGCTAHPEQGRQAAAVVKVGVCEHHAAKVLWAQSAPSQSCPDEPLTAGQAGVHQDGAGGATDKEGH